MILNRTNLELAAFASDDETRPALRSVHIGRGYTEATDGHVMMRVAIPDLDANEFPSIEGMDCTSNGKEALIPADAAKTMAKAIPRKSTLPILQNLVWDARDSTDTELKFAVTDLDTVQRFNPRPVEGPYPPVDNVIPKDNRVFQFSVNASKLAKALAFVAKHTEDFQNNRVRLTFYGPNRAVRLDAKSKDGQQIIGLVMPLNVEV